MYKSDPFYNRIMARLSDKPLTKKVENKLKLSAVSDVVDAEEEASRFFNENLDTNTVNDLSIEIDNFERAYDDLSNQAFSLQTEFEAYDRASSEVNALLEKCRQASDFYESLSTELGLSPEENNDWKNLQISIEELESLQQAVMSFNPDLEKLYNL